MQPCLPVMSCLKISIRAKFAQSLKAVWQQMYTYKGRIINYSTFCMSARRIGALDSCIKKLKHMCNE